MLEPFDEGYYELPLIDRVNIMQGKMAQVIALLTSEKSPVVTEQVPERKRPGRKPKARL